MTWPTKGHHVTLPLCVGLYVNLQKSKLMLCGRLEFTTLIGADTELVELVEVLNYLGRAVTMKNKTS